MVEKRNDAERNNLHHMLPEVVQAAAQGAAAGGGTRHVVAAAVASAIRTMKEPDRDATAEADEDLADRVKTVGQALAAQQALTVILDAETHNLGTSTNLARAKGEVTHTEAQVLQRLRHRANKAKHKWRPVPTKETGSTEDADTDRVHPSRPDQRPQQMYAKRPNKFVQNAGKEVATQTELPTPVQKAIPTPIAWYPVLVPQEVVTDARRHAQHIDKAQESPNAKQEQEPVFQTVQNADGEPQVQHMQQVARGARKVDFCPVMQKEMVQDAAAILDRIKQEQVLQRTVEQASECPVPFMMEERFPVTIKQDMVQDATPTQERVIQSSAERSNDFPAPMLQEEIVQVQDATVVHGPSKQEQVLQRTIEQTVEGPVPSTLEETFPFASAVPVPLKQDVVHRASEGRVNVPGLRMRRYQYGQVPKGAWRRRVACTTYFRQKLRLQQASEEEESDDGTGRDTGQRTSTDGMECTRKVPMLKTRRAPDRTEDSEDSSSSDLFP